MDSGKTDRHPAGGCAESRAFMNAISTAGGIPREFRCYSLEPTGDELALEGAGAILFTSAMSFQKAVWIPRPGLLVMAIGEITAGAIRAGGFNPVVTGDGSLEGTLSALNAYLAARRGEV